MHVAPGEFARGSLERPSAVFEVLCDECETALKFEEFDDALARKRC